MDNIDKLKKLIEKNSDRGTYFEIKDSYENTVSHKSEKGLFCGVVELQDIFSWKKSFAYLWTGTPGSGKTTVSLYMMLLMSLRRGWRWCVWTPEMEDAYIKGNVPHYTAKDIIYLLLWTMTGRNPYADSHDLKAEYDWVCDHFKFIHMNDRRPEGISQAFDVMHQKYGIDGFLIDPWKSIKQVITERSDIWLEDVLFMFKEFVLQTNTIMNYVVHPKSLRDYRDADGEFRVITPFDLSGGAAWFNSMDVIVSLRRLTANLEWHTYKIRKQHLIGKPGSFSDIVFNWDTYRLIFNGNDPFKNEQIN